MMHDYVSGHASVVAAFIATVGPRTSDNSSLTTSSATKSERTHPTFRDSRVAKSPEHVTARSGSAEGAWLILHRHRWRINLDLLGRDPHAPGLIYPVLIIQSRGCAASRTRSQCRAGSQAR
jgi:hypothetical protein